MDTPSKVFNLRGPKIWYIPWHFITLTKAGFELDRLIGLKPPSWFFIIFLRKRSETKKELKERKERVFEKLGGLATMKKKEMENLVYNILIGQPELRKKKKFKEAYPKAVSVKMYVKAKSMLKQR